MGASLRLWAPYPVEGFATLDAAGSKQEKRNDYQAVRKRPLVGEWEPAELQWFRSRKSDKLGAMCYRHVLGGLYFRRAHIPYLFPGEAAQYEFLPVSVEGDEWVVLNCLRDARLIDLASSDLHIPKFPDLPELRGIEPWIDDVSWVNVIEAQALSERWEALNLPASSDASASRHLMLTDVLVDRIRKLDLRGLDFKHVGYIVSDASQVVPKPPVPQSPLPKPTKGKPKTLTSAPLSAGEHAEVAQFGAACRQRLNLTSDSSPAMVLERLANEAQRLRPTFWTVDANEQTRASLELASIYGDLLCEAHGWSWADLRQSKTRRCIGVVSPSLTHALALVPYVQLQMQSKAPTFGLLFNMIGAGNLPVAEAGQLAVIA